MKMLDNGRIYLGKRRTMKKIKKKKTSPTSFKETPEIAHLLDVAERVTGKTRSEILRECVSTEVPRIIKREAPNALRKSQTEMEEIKRLVDEINSSGSSPGKPEGKL
jgi:hypothetical protein